MPLIYALVARGNVVLAEHAENEGNFPTVTRLLLCRLPAHREKMSYIYDRYVFHYIVNDGLMYLTMADDGLGYSLPFAFLEEVRNKFISICGAAAKSAIALSLQSTFEPYFKDLMSRYNSRQAVHHFQQLRSQIEGIHNIMIDNIDKILQRGERIDLLVDRAEQLTQDAVTYRRNARRLKNSFWWRNVRLIGLVLVILTVIGIISGMISCGGVTFPRCRAN